MNQAGIDLVKSFEGFRGKAYLDPVGIPTIGYGFTKGVNLGDVMTQNEADQRLADELTDFEEGVLDLLRKSPTDNQAAALTSLSYNIGLGAFGHSTVLKMHNLGRFQEAADSFRLWVHAGKAILPGLVSRREAERALYLS